MSTQTIDFNNVDSVVFDDSPVEILKLNGVQIWEGARWFNFTGIDANGNCEGMEAYDGTPVAYGIGKPTIKYTTGTDLDGNETVTETVTWDDCNGLNDDYFTEKYGDEYSKYSTSVDDIVQCVEDILVIPDTHYGLPVTTLLPSCFYVFYLGTDNNYYFQPYFYRSIVWGENITTLGNECLWGISKSIDYAITGGSPSKFVLPSTITKMGEDVFGNYGDMTIYPYLEILEVTASQFEGELSNCSYTVIFDSNVAKITARGASKRNFVFMHSNDNPIELDFSGGDAKSASTLNIYTDNDYIKNYDWSTNANITPTFYALSEWTDPTEA